MRFLFIFLISINSVFATNPTWIIDELEWSPELAKAYCEKYAEFAIREMQREGIPASITLAQGMLESNYDRSTLATKGKNHFGMKCHSKWKGKTMYRQDDDVTPSCFRVYDSVEESFVDHTDLLSGNKRYEFLFEFDKKDYVSWAHGLKKAGYATDPKYPEKLINLIESYNLQLYNLESGDVPFKPTPSKPSPPMVVVEGKPEVVFVKNSLKYVVAKAGDSPEKIASRYNLSYRRIYQYNDLPNYGKFNAGDKVYLEFKKLRYRGPQNYHRVQRGETMRTISQLYGVKLKRLYKRNYLKSFQEPELGEKIYLKGCHAPNRPKVRSGAVVLTPPTPPKIDPPKIDPPKPSPTPDPVVKPGNNKPKDEPNPVPKPKEEFYEVQKGDTLFGISKKFGLTVDALKKLNKLVDNTLEIGQKLRVK
jgi:LysM repeat protein